MMKMKEFPLSRSNSLYLVIGALVVVVVGLGTYVVREETKPKGVEMSISSDGVRVEEN
jgi:RsiW-degrading membrane proteinase PrsW (M82 family)